MGAQVDFMEKVISVPSKVDDLYGLFMDLRRADYLVKNVGVDERGTYVYLDSQEEKDPVAKIEAWVGKPAPKLTSSLREKRAKESLEIEALELERRNKREEDRLAREEAERQAREAAERAALEPVPQLDASVGGEDVVLSSGDTLLTSPPDAFHSSKEGWLKRVWKKLF